MKKCCSLHRTSPRIGQQHPHSPTTTCITNSSQNWKNQNRSVMVKQILCPPLPSFFCFITETCKVTSSSWTTAAPNPRGTCSQGVPRVKVDHKNHVWLPEIHIPASTPRYITPVSYSRTCLIEKNFPSLTYSASKEQRFHGRAGKDWMRDFFFFNLSLERKIINK